MENYRNSDSGVRSYAIGDDFITVQFKDGDIYKYSYSSAGTRNIEIMKGLALRGRGLNTFINKYVKKKYVK